MIEIYMIIIIILLVILMGYIFYCWATKSENDKQTIEKLENELDFYKSIVNNPLKIQTDNIDIEEFVFKREIFKRGVSNADLDYIVTDCCNELIKQILINPKHWKCEYNPMKQTRTVTIRFYLGFRKKEK